MQKSSKKNSNQAFFFDKSMNLNGYAADLKDGLLL